MFSPLASPRLAALICVGSALLSLDLIGQERCTYGEWTRPRIVRKTFDDSASIHPLSIAEGPRILVVTAEFPPLVDGGRNLGDSRTPIAVVRNLVTGQEMEIAKPRHDMSYRVVRALIDTKDVVHLFWGEIAGQSTADTTGGTGATQLWTMTVGRNGADAPRLLYASRAARWDDSADEQLTFSDGAGTLYVLLPAEVGATRHPFVMLSFSNGSWSNERVEVGRIVVPAAVSGTARDGAIHVVFTSPDINSQRADFASVFVTTRPSSTSAWTTARLVQGAIGHGAQHPVIATAPGGRVRAFWLQPGESDGIFEASEIRGVELNRAGEIVHGNLLFHSPVNLLEIHSTWSDVCSTTYLHVITGLVGDRMSARTVSWDGARWSDLDVFNDQFWFVGRSVISDGDAKQLRRLWSSAFFAPGLPIMAFWWESTRRLVIPTR